MHNKKHLEAIGDQGSRLGANAAGVTGIQSKTRTGVSDRIDPSPEAGESKGKKIGEVLIENGIISKDNFHTAIKKQEELKSQGKDVPFLQVLVELNYIEPQKFLKVAREHDIYIPMGEILIMEGQITSNQLSQALELQKKLGGKRLGEVLIEDLKVITEDALISILAKQYGKLRIRPDLVYFDAKLFFSVSRDMLERMRFAPYNSYDDEGKKVVQIIISDLRSSDMPEIAKIVKVGAQRAYNLDPEKIRIEFCISTINEITEFTQAVYRDRELLKDKGKNKIEDYLIGRGKEVPIFHIGNEYTSENEILMAFSSIIKKGLDYGASDIHIEPEENKMKIRYRIDGVLKWDSDLPIQMKDVLMRGLKNILQFNDAHKIDKIFDERIKVLYVDKKISADLRVSVLPLLNGDKMVIRLLVQNTEVPSFTDLGMKKNIRIKYQKVCTMSSGIIIVTGPTGSGKTTTLFSTINYLKDDKVNIVTIEDPPEYLITGVNQAKVRSGKEKNGVNYLDALKSTLRQDPDVIMFGEMRDNESASVAMSAGMTGHLLFTTLHTNDAVSSITRLSDLGIRPFMLSSTLVSLMAQRLIRKTCPHCREEYKPSEDDLEFFNVTIDGIDELIRDKKIRFTRGKGCDKCRFTGYKGRIGIFELLCVNEDLKKAVLHNATAKEIEDMAREYGMTSMVEDGFLKIIDGQTTVEEVIRVSRTLQAPKRKRTVAELRYLLEGDLSRDEIIMSIYSGMGNGGSKTKERTLEPLKKLNFGDSGEEILEDLPIVGGDINHVNKDVGGLDLDETQKDSIISGLYQKMRHDIVARLDNIVREGIDSNSLDKMVSLGKIVTELENEDKGN